MQNIAKLQTKIAKNRCRDFLEGKHDPLDLHGSFALEIISLNETYHVQSWQEKVHNFTKKVRNIAVPPPPPPFKRPVYATD